jgi:branched-chain amino acid aminotransferase
MQYRTLGSRHAKNSCGGIMNVAKIDGQPLPQFPSPITTRLHDEYWAIHDEAVYRDTVNYED